MPQIIAQSLSGADLNMPDGRSAFHIASDMENVLARIQRTASAIEIVAPTLDKNDLAQEALFGLAETLEDIFKQAEDMREQIFDKTWAYVYRHNASHMVEAIK